MKVGFTSNKVATQDIDSGLGGKINTVWDDVTTSLLGRRLYTTTGKVDYDYDEGDVKFQQGGDLTDKANFVIMSIQYPHKAVVGSGAIIAPHIHFIQPDSSKYIFSLAYRYQDNGEVKNTSWTTLNADTDNDCVFTYPGSGNFNNILMFGTLQESGAIGIDASALTISATLQFKLTRTDIVGATDVHVTFFDYHTKFDTMGSFTEYGKREQE